MTQSFSSEAAIEITNLGGIESLQSELPPGVCILSGQNATNRTSFLRALAAAMGGDESAATLKSDSETGSVTVNIGDRIGSRTYERVNGSVVRGGDPFSERGELVDTYASIFATNPARVAVRNGGDGLRDILMRGVDTAEIKATIHSLKQERSSLESELESIERAKRKLPNLRERRERLRAERDELEAEIDDVEQTIAEYDASSDGVQKAEAQLEELQDNRERLRRIEREIEQTKSTIEDLEGERATLQTELEELSVKEDKRERLAEKRASLEERIEEEQSTIAKLNDIISHNRTVLDGDGVLGAFDSNDDVAAQLNPNDATVECWTCGSEVNRSDIQSRIETLESIRQEKNDDLQELRTQVRDLNSELEDIEKEANRKRRLRTELRETESAVEAERDTLTSLEDDAADLRETIGTLEDRVAETEELRDSDLSDAYERLSRLQHELGSTETKLASVDDEIDEIETQVERADSVEDRLSAVRDELADARGRIKQIEHDVVDRFNDQMDDLVELLGYDNISRVWLERIADEGQEVSAFEIHLVRESESGTVYEDSLDNLSESEREIIGIVVALSGYLVHDIAEEVPLVLFDSIESIDATRLERLFDYIDEYAPFIVSALLPEDASAIDHETVEAPAFART